MPASPHSEGNQMTSETVRTKFEYVDDDEPDDPIGMLRDTIERVMDTMPIDVIKSPTVRTA